MTPEYDYLKEQIQNRLHEMSEPAKERICIECGIEIPEDVDPVYEELLFDEYDDGTEEGLEDLADALGFECDRYAYEAQRAQNELERRALESEYWRSRI